MPATHELDLARMRRGRHQKLQVAMADAGIGGLLLLTSGNVTYSTGVQVVQADNGRTYQLRTVALVLAGEEHPHLFTPYPEGAPAELPDDHLHPPLVLEGDEGVDDLARQLHALFGGRDVGVLGIDDHTVPMFLRLPKLLAPIELVEAGGLLAEARLTKSPDEQECMRRAWYANEAASQAVEAALRPGLRLTEASGIYLRHLFENGSTCNFLDPIFQAMPLHKADGPWSTNDDAPFALVTNDHILRQGDVVWTDTVSGYEGYASDVGRTWVVGDPTPGMHRLFRRWKEITDGVIDLIRPGTTGADLTRFATEANGGEKPWLAHYFLGHTLGIEGGEPQQIGSDKGPAYDESFVLAPGMAVIVEPVVWEEGEAGYRCEELLFVTEDGCEQVSRYPNHPFE
jgi:Xaa-Pro dipeptidase